MPIVETAAGAIRGIEENGILAFLGVPYAAPVTPERWFRAPEPAEAWRGVRDATRPGAVCPQIPTYGTVGRGATSRLEFGTDFLTVNIRTPGLDGRAPVLVWIHGGGYAVGSANETAWQTGAFAVSGIVEVTVNYRLGALGFLSLPGAPDNRGLLDQIAALAWVRDNIAAFGGDPDRVTLAGRSAGGFSVAALMAMPAAHGLFARALPQSGASTGIATPDDAAKLTHRVLSRLGVDAAGLTGVPIADLLVAQRDLCNESYEQHDFDRDGTAAMLGVPFVPVIDGVSLPEHPEAAAAEGRAAPVPMMIGCTSAEYLVHSTAQPDMDDAECARRLHERVRPLGLAGAEIVARYRAVLPEHSGKGLWRAIAGDLVFQNPTTRLARLHARHQPVLKYLFGRIDPDETGAAHGAEVGHVWYRPGMAVDHLRPHQAVTDRGFAETVHDVWTRFIAGTTPIAAPVIWPPHAAGNESVLRLADGRVWVEDDPFARRVALFM